LEATKIDLPLNQVRKIVQRALAEDIGSGDITTAALVNKTQQGKGMLLAKAEGIIAGLPVAKETFFTLDPAVEFSAKVKDGAKVKPGTELATTNGKMASLLTAERVALNFLMHLSGIATLTGQFVAAVKGTKARIVDTRKTSPGLRLLEKYAVRMGGGQNHRFGLDDGILIKDNHIAAAGGIAKAVALAQTSRHHLLKIEVECATLKQVKEAIAAEAEAILLDNMDLATLAKAVDLVGGRAICEASGRISLENVGLVAETGVDLISIGRLTHSAPALDLSLEITS